MGVKIGFKCPADVSKMIADNFASDSALHARRVSGAGSRCLPALGADVIALLSSVGVDSGSFADMVGGLSHDVVVDLIAKIRLDSEA